MSHSQIPVGLHLPFPTRLEAYQVWQATPKRSLWQTQLPVSGLQIPYDEKVVPAVRLIPGHIDLPTGQFILPHILLDL